MNALEKIETLEKLEKLERQGKIRFSHSSMARGYVSRKVKGYVRKYSGKFGKGYIFASPSF